MGKGERARDHEHFDLRAATSDGRRSTALSAVYPDELCVALPQSLWDHLHSTFGGGPACTRLYECANCRAELDALTRQKKFELEEFKTLHQEFQEQETPSAIFCLSSSWFKVWEGFVSWRGCTGFHRWLRRQWLGSSLS